MPGEAVTDEEILAVMDGKRLVAGSDVADTVGVTRMNALRRMKALRDEGRVNHKYAGANGDMWYRGAYGGLQQTRTRTIPTRNPSGNGKRPWRK